MDNSQVQTQESQSSISPQQVIDILRDGNQRFVSGSQVSRDLAAQADATTGGQYPFAAVLSCIDSRAPAELIFDQGIGDIFNARIAGNFVNDDILGSLEFACKVAGSKAVVVMGHSSCGAIKGAIDDVELGNLTGMLAKLKPAVSDVKSTGADGSSGDAGFVQSVVESNVRLTVNDIRERSAVLKEMEDAGEIAIVGAVYDLSSKVVTFM